MVLLLPEGKNKHKARTALLPTSLPRLIFLLALVSMLVVLVINFHVFSYGKRFILVDNNGSPFPSESKEIPVAIVLGASVYSDGTLSPILEERAKTALNLYKDGKVQKLIVSGDNRVSSYNEVIPIREYLLENEIPAEDIFTDFAGFNTYDSMYRAGKIFGAKDVLVVTQSFHLPRAIYAARNLGLNAYGVTADTGEQSVRDIKDNTREIGATVKTFIEVVTRAKPLFLGRQISIEGDGRESLR